MARKANVIPDVTSQMEIIGEVYSTLTQSTFNTWPLQ
jgi:hypothetical protein